MSALLIDAGACWQCDDSVLVPADKRGHAAQFQMLFCSDECHRKSVEAGTLYGRGLIVRILPA